MTASVARFYGWAWESIKPLPFRTFLRFYRMIPELSAREKLVGAVVAAFPHMTEKYREQVRRDWVAAAGLGPAMYDQEKRIPWKDVGKFLGRKG